MYLDITTTSGQVRGKLLIKMSAGPFSLPCIVGLRTTLASTDSPVKSPERSSAVHF